MIQGKHRAPLGAHSVGNIERFESIFANLREEKRKSHVTTKLKTPKCTIKCTINTKIRFKRKQYFVIKYPHNYSALTFFLNSMHLLSSSCSSSMLLILSISLCDSCAEEKACKGFRKHRLIFPLQKSQTCFSASQLFSGEIIRICRQLGEKEMPRRAF